MKLNDSSLMPLYQQVHGEIKAAITSGRYLPGDKLPSEVELSKRYSVSRVTIRRAIDELSSEGYLTSRQGKGTFVNQHKLARKIRQGRNVTSFSDVCSEMGMVAGAHVLTRRVVPAEGEGREFFGSGCSQLVHVSLLRTADGIPVMEENSFFPFEQFAFLLKGDLENVPLFDLVAKRSRRLPQHCGMGTIEMVLCDVRRAERLAISAGEPLFFERAFFLDQDGAPLCMSNKYLVGSRCMFEI